MVGSRAEIKPRLRGAPPLAIPLDMRRFEVLAPAKVNLTLDVLRRRPDGFHDLASLFVPLDLSDRLTVAVGGRAVQVRVPGHPALAGGDNLCAKAARAFEAETGLSGAVRVTLEKRIPVAAGLGGGSSDAAAVLRCLARAHGLRAGDPRLAAAALRVGSDVPFFLRATPALAEGRGERLRAAPALPALHLVIVKPPFGVAARDAYAWLAERRDGRTRRPRPLPRRLATAADVARIVRNDLEAPVAARHPAIASLVGALRARGALAAAMSGSGSCVFGLFGERAEARKCAAALGERHDVQIFVARTLRRPPAVRETPSSARPPSGRAATSLGSGGSIRWRSPRSGSSLSTKRS